MGPNNRLHRSLPALDLEAQPENSRYQELYYFHKGNISRVEAVSRNKKSKWKNTKSCSSSRSNDALTFILSALYGKVLAILGIALPVTGAIANSDFNSYDGFYMYLYLGSIIFLLYIYFVQSREKEHWRYCSANGYCYGNCESNDSLYYKGSQHSRYGSFYFRMGVTGFGIGSVIYSGLQFGQYFDISSADECSNLMKAIKPFVRIVFVLGQVVFVFSYSNFINVRKTKTVAQFGLMHMVATNLCEWLYVIVQETQHDIYRSSKENTTVTAVDFQFLNSNTFKITKQLFEEREKCLKSNVMESILVKLETYLAPCSVEYNLMSAVILVLMWRNIYGSSHRMNTGKEKTVKSNDNKNSCKDTNKLFKASPLAGIATDNHNGSLNQNGADNLMYARRQNQFSVDCAQAHKGLFSGILVLAVTVISLIMFFELVSYKEHQEAAIWQVNVWESVLFWTGTVAVLICIAALRDVGYCTMKRDLELEHLLLLVTQCGVFMYFLFQIIGALLMGIKGTGGIMRAVTPISALVQSSCQTVLVLEARQRRCSTRQQMHQKPGRQWITFLLLLNIALWAVNRLKNNHSNSHPNQMNYYGILAWNIITHVSIPLAVSYRFQSTVCFFEIWKHVYKMRPIHPQNHIHRINNNITEMNVLNGDGWNEVNSSNFVTSDSGGGGGGTAVVADSDGNI